MGVWKAVEEAEMIRIRNLMVDLRIRIEDEGDKFHIRQKSIYFVLVSKNSPPRAFMYHTNEAPSCLGKFSAKPYVYLSSKKT